MNLSYIMSCVYIDCENEEVKKENKRMSVWGKKNFFFKFNNINRTLFYPYNDIDIYLLMIWRTYAAK